MDIMSSGIADIADEIHLLGQGLHGHSKLEKIRHGMATSVALLFILAFLGLFSIRFSSLALDVVRFPSGFVVKVEKLFIQIVHVRFGLSCLFRANFHIVAWLDFCNNCFD